jgi:PAS domain S-box-containing protein/diguanylate cyclase (GGDEF)-like protein
MNGLIKILMVEDSVTDAELIHRGLVRDGLVLESRRVETRDAYLSELDRFRPHLIISDFSLPSFDGLSALEIAHEAYPDVPFMFVSGTIDEDTAIAALRGGAIDYVPKSNLKRLAPAVRRALDEVRIRAARAQAESRFRDLIEFSPSAIVVINERGTIEIVNACTETLLGYERDEMLGRPCEALIPERFKEFHEAFRKTDYDGLQLKPSVGFETKGRRKDGSEFPAEINLSPLKTESGLWVSGVIRDISERKWHEQRIDRLNRIQMVLSNINAAGIRIREREALCQEACEIAVKHGQFALAWIGMMKPGSHDGTPIAWHGANDDYMTLVRLTTDPDKRESARPAGHAIRHKIAVICNDIQADPTMAAVVERAGHSGFRSVVALPLLVSGEAIGVIVLYAKDTNFFNQEEMVLLNQLAADISFALEHQQNQNRLSYLAYYDSSTDLPNRSLFHDRLRHLLSRKSRHAGQIAVVLIDIDRFRNINDTLGRSAGNLLLKEAGSRLRQCISEPEYVARVDANSFAFVVRCSLDGVEVIDFLETKLALRMAEPFHLMDKEIRISVKAGIAMFPADGTEGDALLRNAEAALHNAKISKVPHLFYNSLMSTLAAAKLSMENRLKRALEQEQFTLHYQPKIDLASGELLVGLEALIRWNEPGHGLVPPGQFIQVLEETGLIVDVGAWVIMQAHRQYQDWAVRGLMPPRIAVNVSQLQIRQKNFVSQVLHIMDGTYSDELEIEITESLFMEDLDDSIEKLGMLRKAGITVAIDDFGTGYSSLSYIARLPIDTLKIDRSFTTDMATRADHMAIVSTIISLAHALNLKVVAEGVETNEQSLLLKQLGCDQAQGFLYGRPLLAEEIEAIWLGNPRRRYREHAY